MARAVFLTAFLILVVAIIHFVGQAIKEWKKDKKKERENENQTKTKENEVK